MIRGHIIELKPNNVQANHLARACGVARKASTTGLCMSGSGSMRLTKRTVMRVWPQALRLILKI